jgi:hypothetical protein
MKASPIQLLQSTIEKLSVEANPDYVASTAASSEDVPLEVREICEPFPTFWEGQAQSPEGIAERTFMVRLALRTDPDLSGTIPYPFEMIFSGVVACMPKTVNGFPPALTARQYGLAMIYGAMREQFLVMTSRMPYGPRLLPTVSFMEPDLAVQSPEVIDSLTVSSGDGVLAAPASKTKSSSTAASPRAKRVVGVKRLSPKSTD